MTVAHHGVAAKAAAALVLVGALSVAGWVGCSIEKNYDTLSFFFDGVPDPHAKIGTGPGAVVVDLRASPTYSVHKPFEEDRCGDCHGGRYRLSLKDSGVCLKCHASVTSSEERLHGPVAAAACLWCHTPHESAYAKLLKNEARAVCSQCHEPGQLGVERVPEHGDASRSCLECHFGHGGSQRYFLRKAAGVPAVPAPAAQQP